MEILDRKYLGKQASQKEFQLLPVLIWSRKNQKRLLLYIDFNFIWARNGGLEVVYFRLSEDEGSGFDCSFFESDSSGHIFDVLDDEVHADSIVSESRNNDICIYYRGQDEVSEGIFNEFVVLFEYADDWPASFCGVSFESSTKSNVVWLKQVYHRSW